MDDTDHAMQAELASQAGSIAHSDKMELEQEDLNTVRDAEMEIHDIEAEGTIEDMKAAIALDDAEMTAEMQEQEHMQAERDWKDVDADVELVPVDDGHDAQANADAEAADGTTSTPTPIETTPSQDVDAYDQLEDVNEAGNGITDSETGNVQAVTDTEAGQQTLEETLGSSVTDPQAALDNAETELAKSGVHSDEARLESSSSAGGPGGVDAAPVQNGTDQYTDADEANGPQHAEAYEPIASTSAVLVEDFHPTPSNLGQYGRPVLQKDYLAHVEVFSGDPPSLRNGSTGLAAPHVSLLYNNDSYSLFRPSSVPSGDNEQVVFGEDEEQQLYYAPLDTLIGKLHEAFPQLRGDGNNELILDFGFLDMQIYEDNVYTQQLSLYDFDRIRVGMGQPELDRLQVNLLLGKRFVYKFNELAEHVYRMHAGSEYDSGTIYDDNAEDEENIPEYYEEGAAEEDAFRTAEEVNAAETEADDARLAAEDAALPEEAKPDQLVRDVEEQEIEQEEEPIEYPDEEEEEQGEADTFDGVPANLEEEEPAPDQEEIHPPSDEYYEDPEFSQKYVDVDEEVGEEEEDAYNAGVEYEAEEENGSDETVQDYAENENGANGDLEEEAVEELPIDPDAPLEEVAEQIEEFEEGTLQQEEDVATEAKAARHEEVVTSTTSVNVEAVDKDTERIYDGMDSLAAEQQGKVDPHQEPTTPVAPELPIKRNNSIGKRARDDEEEEVSGSNGQIGDAVAGSLTNDDHSKRQRVSPDA